MRGLIFALAAGGILVGVQARAAEPVPFEAVYELTVKNWKLPGEILRVTGSQIVRAEKTCTDWALVGAFRLDAANAQGGGTRFETDVAGTEARDGTRLQFRSTTKLNGETVSQLAGTASRAVAGQAGKVTLSIPEQRVSPLPPDALFPMAAFRWTASQWERGKKNTNYVLFDGTGADPVRVFEILTGIVPLPDPLPEGDRQLLSGRAWRTSGSFHTYEGGGAEPLTTLIQNVLPNGIATELSLDIGFADVVLHLRRVRALVEPRC